MRKETTLNHIILRTRARVVRHANFHTNVVSQPLHIMLEEILVGSIAAATVTEPQDRGCLGITALSNTVPIPAKAVTRKLARVMRQAEVHMPAVAHPIVKAVRNQHAVSPAGEIMIEGVKRLRAADSTGPKQLAEMLFRFSVNRKIGIAGFFVRGRCIIEAGKS